MPRSLARVLLLQGLRPDQIRARTALAPRRAPRAAGAGRGGAVSQCRRPARRPQPLCRSGRRPTWPPGCRRQASFPSRSSTRRRSITVLTKEVLADQNATTLKQAVLNTAGVTLGTGEGGNAFGDRFFIRGFDARNDVFLDGMRDAGVSVRENFFTEQVEILRGPGSSFAGRGTTGGAINIVTKQATTEKSFYNMDTTFGTDHTKRVVLDVNQVISPTLAIRAGGLFQDAGVAGRNYIKDDRDGGFVAAKWTPLDTVKLYANYIHTNLHGLPDFGVPYYRPGSPDPAGKFTTTAGGPYPGFRRQPQQFLRLRQPRLLQHQAGHRHGRRRGHDHAGPDAEQQDQGAALGARLHRNAAGSAGPINPLRNRTLSPIRRAAIRSPRTSPTRPRRSTSSTSAAGRIRRLAASKYSREIASIDKYAGPQFGSAAGRSSPVATSPASASSIRNSRSRRSAAIRNGRACRPRSPSIPRAAI